MLVLKYSEQEGTVGLLLALLNAWEDSSGADPTLRQAAEYKHEMGRLGKELRDVKMKYFEQKKKDLAERERIRAERAPAAETLALEARSTLTRFTGGGFNLSAPWSAPSHSGIQSSQGALS